MIYFTNRKKRPGIALFLDFKGNLFSKRKINEFMGHVTR